MPAATPALLFALVLGLRGWLDLSVVPLPLAQALTALAALGFGALAVREVPTHPLRGPALGFGALVLLLGPREGTLAEAVAMGHLLVPVAVLLAAPRLDGRWPWVVLGLGVLPVAWSVGALAAGQPDDHVLHGLPRLHGGYRNLHGHAVGMALYAVLGGALALRPGDRRGRGAAAALGALALAMMAASWVRTTMIFVALAWGTLLVLGRRWRVLGGLGLLGLLALLASATLRARFGDLVSLLTLTAPSEGWGALGSWRGRIWVESTQAWLAGPPHTLWLGRGAGHQVGLHRHLDPHLEYLSLLFQLGPAGLLAWLMLALTALVRCVREGTAEGRLAAALLVAVLATNAISNDFLTRATLAWATWAAVGHALRPARADRPAGGATAPPPAG